jgi:hypothetical protein
MLQHMQKELIRQHRERAEACAPAALWTLTEQLVAQRLHAQRMRSHASWSPAGAARDMRHQKSTRVC